MRTHPNPNPNPDPDPNPEPHEGHRERELELTSQREQERRRPARHGAQRVEHGVHVQRGRRARAAQPHTRERALGELGVR